MRPAGRFYTKQKHTEWIFCIIVCTVLSTQDEVAISYTVYPAVLFDAAFGPLLTAYNIPHPGYNIPKI